MSPLGANNGVTTYSLAIPPDVDAFSGIHRIRILCTCSHFLSPAVFIAGSDGFTYLLDYQQPGRYEAMKCSYNDDDLDADCSSVYVSSGNSESSEMDNVSLAAFATLVGGIVLSPTTSGSAITSMATSSSLNASPGSTP